MHEFHCQPQGRQSQTGNTLAEYVLPALLIVVAAIGGMAILGNDLQAQLSGVKSSMTSGMDRTRVQVQVQQAQKVAFESTVEAKKSANPSAASTIRLSDIGVPAMSRVIQKVGANGATNVLASAMSGYIQQLKENGNLTPAQLSTLSQLANAGA